MEPQVIIDYYLTCFQVHHLSPLKYYTVSEEAILTFEQVQITK